MTSRTDSISQIQFHRDGILHLPQHSQNSSRQNSGSVRDNQSFSSQNNCHSQIIPISFGKTQCSSRLCNSRETSSQTITNVSSSTMETSYSFTSPPNQANTQYWVSSQLVEQSSNLSKRCSYQEPFSFSPVIHRCQSDWLGSSSGAGGSIISWHLDPRPITTPYQSSRNDNSFLETSALSTDNTTVVAYLRLQGGTHSPDLCLEVWNTLIWCQQNKICLVIRHIPGKFNILADHLSRTNKLISLEWSLNQSLGNAIFQRPNFLTEI